MFKHQLDKSAFISKFNTHVYAESIRMLNFIGIALERIGISPANRSEGALMEAACRHTGLSDWGDELFRDALSILLESYRKDADLSLFGWMIVHSDLIHHLKNRLLIQDTIKRFPKITDEKIRQPIFIVSLPRTGTTLLQRLLSLDTSNRSPLTWEMITPAPPPTPQTHGTDIRIRHAIKMLKNLYRIAPQLPHIHAVQATEPEECVTLLANSLVFPSFAGNANLKRYIEWIEKQDMTLSYQYHRLQLQMLQFYFPKKRWVLKAPLHMLYLNEIINVFPDACIVQTHRNPLEVVPSTCSLMFTSRKMLSNSVKPEIIGQQALEITKQMIADCNHTRNGRNANRFFDISYDELTRRPLETVSKIYDYFGFDFSDDFQERIRRYLKENPKNKHGVHRYSLEQFGLYPDEIREGFSEYCQSFSIEIEE